MKMIPDRMSKDAIIPEEYAADFHKAILTFRHQLVMDPKSRKVVPLSSYPDGLDLTQLQFAGEKIDDDLSMDISWGNIDPYSLKEFSIPTKYYNPDDVPTTNIWSSEYELMESPFNIQPVLHGNFPEEPQVWSCDHCEEEFENVGEFKSHLKIHGATLRYPCSNCEKDFSSQLTLHRHQLVHLSQSPYKCDVCNQQFAYPTSLTVHIRTHTGEKPYRCGWCTQQFAQQSSCTQHER